MIPSHRNGLVERYYPEIRFGGYTRVDGTVTFYTRVNAVVAQHHVVLDIGCGRGKRDGDGITLPGNSRSLRGKARRIVGIDIDPGASSNENVDEFRLIDRDRWPVADASIDVAISDFVLEHVKDPDTYFAELDRVLVPGGVFCARTPNRLGYVPVIAAIVPNRLHAPLLDKVQDHRDCLDVFATYYRCNSRRRLRKYFDEYGYDSFLSITNGAPRYLGRCRPLFAAGVWYHRFVPDVLGMTIMAFARKPG